MHAWNQVINITVSVGLPIFVMGLLEGAATVFKHGASRYTQRTNSMTSMLMLINLFCMSAIYL